ncbi:hypothetical protein N3K66_004314 [Trichothecium roseum]|uniref:Uncharacterized protein n=1 Tax=Trichothecium roseum TaxID=47278 RepID=A0ACC0V108_9HYPO|nr:hypothetical protein N3K66_004314 [Trichothecium roseum]
MAEANPTKRLKTAGSGPLIGTHSGHFHADEALAVHMLRMLPAYSASPLVRTRDPKVLETCHTVVDVGGEYDAARHRYDHHQRGFDAVFPGRPTKLSSAGLVYLHFGRALIAGKLGASPTAAGTGTGTVTEDSPDVSLLHDKLYESFIEALDAHDNGISSYDPKALAEAGIEKRFSSGGFTLGALVGRLNGNWNDPPAADAAEAQAREDARFERASCRIGEEFESALDYYTSAWLPARTIVQQAFERRREFDPEGRVIVFDQGVPWKDHLYTLEEEKGEPGTLYVLYPEKQGDPASKWRIQCVPETSESFVSRKPLPEAWRGFRDEELDGISGVPGCVFVHAAGFIGGNKTYDGIMEMTKKALA